MIRAVESLFKETQKFSFLMTNRYFKRAKKVPMRRATYLNDLNSIQLAAIAQVCEEIQNNHANDPYESADVVIGDLQIILTESFNTLQKLNGRDSRIGLEDLFSIDEVEHEKEAANE